MSDEGERTCPLCAEEMDLTDQQLRPCKCGYQICVWCWHHIMDMAEKDNTEGRCPACRSPYDKEKIVGMAANCERLVAEVHMERKMKSQKAKSKSSEGRKQLNDVRVIRRNLVYIVGLPLDLADEDLLQRREYFGQYGKVLKVSMSRTAAGVVQQFPNSTCSVYITYSKEEEAVRCIQNVHGFVLEGRPLRACFGTTKYCHAWLRNMPCSNPDCVYLHEIGSQEDSFTKDEIVSAYTSHVQHITGAATNMERRSGNLLPPPLDDCTSNTSDKPVVKNTSSNSVSTVRGSPPIGSPAKPMAPPAAWGLRATNCQPAAGNLSCPTGLSKPKSDSISSTLPFSSAVASTNQVSLHSESIKRQVSSDGRHNIVPGEKRNTMNVVASASEKTLSSDVSLAPMNSNTQLSSIPLARDSCTTSNTTKSIDIKANTNGSFCPDEEVAATNQEIQNLSYGLSSVDLDRNTKNEHYNVTKPSSPPLDYVLVKSMQSQGSEHTDKFSNVINTNAANKASISDSEICKSKEQYDLKLDSQSELASGYVEVEDDVTSFDSQRLKDPEVVSHSYSPRSRFPHVANHNNPHPLQHGEPCTVVNAGSLAIYNEVGYEPKLHGSEAALCNGYSEKSNSTSSYRLLHDESNDHHIGRLTSKTVNIGNDARTTDNGESSIISNILSMEFDAWDDLAKLLRDSTENQNRPLKKSSSCNVQTNQSRFSFARQEESKIQTFDMNPSHGANQQLLRSRSLIQDFMETTDTSLDKVGIAYGFPANNIEESENLGSGQFVASSNKLSANSKPQISAPPGFSVPSRPPPPGFSSHERMGQTFDSISGNSLLDPFSWRNSYQTPSTGNFGGAGDIEFMDPAILAVGKGRLQGALNSPTLDMQSNYTPQLNYLENEARLQLLMQRSLSPQHNHRFSEVGNTFSQLGDPYGISSRIDQSHVSNLATFPQLSLQQSRNAVLSNGNWDGWNEMQNGNRMGMAELLRNERPEFSKFYRGYDDSKYQMPNSGDLYNRTFGI